MRATLFLVLLALAGCKRGEPAAEQTAEGSALFASACARCHGENGGGGLPIDGGHAPRNFRDAEFQRTRSDEQIRVTIRNGKDAMPAFSNAFTDDQLRGLVGQVRSFAPR